MQLTASMRFLLGLVLVVAGIAYLLLIEFAVNAGRVHRGVTVSGLDVGGLNGVEARELLGERGEEMKAAPLIFTTDGFECTFTPEDVGWGPQPFDTTESAMAVGRDGGVFEALGDRWKAWTGGVDVSWAGGPDPALVDRELDHCEQQAKALGVEVDRPRLRYRIKSAIEGWPREPVALPLRA